MRNCLDRLNYLIKARAPIIWATSYEEYSFINDLCEYALKNGYKLNSWAMSSVYDTYNLVDRNIQETSNITPQQLFANLNAAQNDEASDHVSTITIIKDAHIVLENNTIKRLVRDLKEFPTRNYEPLILLSPITIVPLELEKLVTVFNYDLPDRNEISNMVDDLYNTMEKVNSSNSSKKFTLPSEKEKKTIINALLGLTINEIRFVLTHSVVQHNALNIDTISQNKINIIEKSGLLDYIVPKVNFEDIGGNEAFKQWIDDIEYTFSEEAKEFGCEAPQGYMALGIAGTGKTVIAEAIANKWGYPLFVFNVSKIFDKLVGQSEKKIEQALRIVKSCAPCVLLFDEAEKIFGGYSGSDSDGGTSSRVFSSILRFMAENHNVFIVMTSNDVSRLPPELTRSGRLDTTWYFGFPTADERKEIFKIHFNKTGHAVSDAIINAAVKETNQFTGAEIKNIVKQTMWKTFKQVKDNKATDITLDDVKYAVSKVMPVSKTSKEKIANLENYAKNRALFANSKNNERSNDNSFDELLALKI